METQTKDFTQQMLVDFLPRLKKIVKSEEKHLQWLKDHGAGKPLINCSENMLAHYKLRLAQYEDYVLEHWES